MGNSLPVANSKSYTASLKFNREEDSADIKIPIVPDVGGLSPSDPLKLRPVPSAAKLPSGGLALSHQKTLKHRLSKWLSQRWFESTF